MFLEIIHKLKFRKYPAIHTYYKRRLKYYINFKLNLSSNTEVVRNISLLLANMVT